MPADAFIASFPCTAQENKPGKIEAMPLIIQIQAKRFGRYALVIGSSILVGVAIFFGTAIVLDFLFQHLVVRNSDPEEFGPGSGLIVVFAWLFFGTIFGLTGLVLMLRRFWPRRRDGLDHASVAQIALIDLGCCWLFGDVYLVGENVILRETWLGFIPRFVDKFPPAVGNSIFPILWVILMVGWTIPLGLGFKGAFRPKRSSTTAKRQDS